MVWHTVFHKITEDFFVRLTHEINSQYYKLLSILTIFNQQKAELKKEQAERKIEEPERSSCALPLNLSTA